MIKLQDRQLVSQLSMINNTTIKVGVKIKPAPSNCKQIIVKSQHSEGKLPMIYVNIGNESKKFQVDAIHDANTDKGTMFTDLQIDKFIDSFINGYNVTIMAYGHTGAGKTYCIEGNSNQSGIILDSICMIYSRINPGAIVSCSYIQLYNQKIFDLLSEYSPTENLKLRYEIEKEFIVEDLSVHQVQRGIQLERMFRKGAKNRVVAANKVHDMSSRSHALFTIIINDRDADDNIRMRQMTFVDLAGSERLFDHVGRLSKESIQINKSLFVLRKVIKMLQQATLHKKQMYIPYRDSKLTSLLKSALGGNCLTMIIACIDSVIENKQQTMLSLNYAISAGRIENSARVNIDQQVYENKKLKAENDELRRQLEVALKQIEMMHYKYKCVNEQYSMNEYAYKVVECIGTIGQLIKSNKELREELDEERRIKRQQKLQIEMLLQEGFTPKKKENGLILNDDQLLKKLQLCHCINHNPFDNRHMKYDLKELKNTRNQLLIKKGMNSNYEIMNKKSIFGATGTLLTDKSQDYINSERKIRVNSVIRRKKVTVYRTELDRMD